MRFKRANVIHASGTIGGDGGYPFFDMSSGGSLAGTIAAEEKMLSLSDDRTRIVPDEGAPASTADLKASRDALVTIRARVQKLIDDCTGIAKPGSVLVDRDAKEGVEVGTAEAAHQPRHAIVRASITV